MEHFIYISTCLWRKYIWCGTFFFQWNQQFHLLLAMFIHKWR